MKRFFLSLCFSLQPFPDALGRIPTRIVREMRVERETERRIRLWRSI